MYLTPEWLALEEKWGSRPTISGTLEELRAGYEGLSNMLASQEQHSPDPSVLVRKYPNLIEAMGVGVWRSCHNYHFRQDTSNDIITGDEVIYGGLRLRIYTPKEVHELGDKVPIGV